MSEQDALILVVDDNEMNRDMLSRRLKRMSYETIVAEDGAQALKLVQQHPFNLVLLDIMMPGISGYEVLEHIKQDEVTQHMPVIMISAVDDLDSVVRCIELGAEDYLFKPFNPVLLKARVGASLKKSMTMQPSSAAIKAIQDAVDVLKMSDLSDGQQTAVNTIEQHLSGLNPALKPTD